MNSFKDIKNAIKYLDENGLTINELIKEVNNMPLKKGKSKKVEEDNFHELKKAHPEMPNKQRIAIVLNQARRSGAKIPKGKKK